MFEGSKYLFVIIRYFSFAFFLCILYATQLFSTPVTSSNLHNQAPLLTELRLIQATKETNKFYGNPEGHNESLRWSSSLGKNSIPKLDW